MTWVKRRSPARFSISLIAASVYSSGICTPAFSRGSRVAPDLRFPVVRRGRHRRAEFDVAFVAAAAEQRHHQAVGYVEQVQQLLAHHRQVGAGMRAVLRIGVDAHAGERRHARIVRRIGERRARPAADLLAMLAPALRQERVQVGWRSSCRDARRNRRCRVASGCWYPDGDPQRSTFIGWLLLVIASAVNRSSTRCPPGSSAAGDPASRPAPRRCLRSASADSRSRTAASRRSRSPR